MLQTLCLPARLVPGGYIPRGHNTAGITKETGRTVRSTIKISFRISSAKRRLQVSKEMIGCPASATGTYQRGKCYSLFATTAFYEAAMRSPLVEQLFERVHSSRREGGSFFVVSALSTNASRFRQATRGPRLSIINADVTFNHHCLALFTAASVLRDFRASRKQGTFFGAALFNWLIWHF